MRKFIKYLAEHIHEFVAVLKKPVGGYLYVPAVGTEVYDHLDNVHSVTTAEKPFVIRGIFSEERAISPKELGNTYQLARKYALPRESRELTVEYFETHEVPTQDKPLELETKIDSGLYWALFVPKDIKLGEYTSGGNIITVNKPHGSHYEGDYVICPSDENSNPILKEAWAVNGNLFSYNFDVIAEWHKRLLGEDTAKKLSPTDRGMLHLVGAVFGMS